MVKNVDQDPFHSNYGPILQHLHPQLPQQEPPWSWTSGLLKRVMDITSIKLLRAKSPHAWTHSWVWTPCTSPAPASPFSSSLFAPSVCEPRKKKFIDLCHSLCVVWPLPTTCSTFHPILPGTFISTGSVMKIVQSNMWTSRIVNNSILSK